MSFGSLSSNMSAGEVEGGARSTLGLSEPVSEVPSTVPLPLVTVADGGAM